MKQRGGEAVMLYRIYFPWQKGKNQQSLHRLIGLSTLTNFEKPELRLLSVC